MKSDQELFLRTPVRKAMMRMAIPTVISSLVLVIYNMADPFLWARPTMPARWRRFR